MHFYGWTWKDIMGTRLKLFWTLMKQMHRLKAGENLRQFQILALASNGEEADRKTFIDIQHKNMGIIQISDERDDEGIQKLMNM